MRHWLWASLLLSSAAFALNLGDITVSSAFNEPLVATIPLEISSGTNASDYKLSLQGLPAGVPPFEATVVASQKPFIKLTSTKPLSHNYIQFDLLAKNKTEELRQAYVISFNKKPLAKSPKPMIYGPVKDGETLWNVAKAFSDHYNIPLDKAMVQLYENNPRAFVKNKKDALMAGSYLRLPQMHQPAPAPKLAKTAPAKQPAVAATPAVDLKKTVAQEVATVIPTLPELEDEGKAVAVNLNQVTGSLELLVPNRSGNMPVSETLQNILGKDEQAFVSLLDNIKSELALSREAIDTERRAKEALQSQLNDMQIQLKALTELIHLKDTEMKSMLTAGTTRLETPTLADTPRFIPQVASDTNTPPWMDSIANNQLILLLMAIAVASSLVFLGDHLAARRRLKKATPAPVPMAKPTATLKAQSLQQPPFLLQDIDVYVAHGRFNQAEDLLEQALSQNPNDFDVLYKLFQVYVKSDNRFAYENKINRISARWKQKFPARWKRVQDLYDRAWPMGFDGHGSSGGGDEAYEGDPPSDPVQTKLDLAKAYIDIGNHDNAVEILIEVVNEGNEAQVLAAQLLLSNMKH